MGCHGGSGGFTLNYSILLQHKLGWYSIHHRRCTAKVTLWHKINGTQSSVGGGSSNKANKPGVNLSSSDLDLIGSMDSGRSTATELFINRKAGVRIDTRFV